jgi:hypothetical protein
MACSLVFVLLTPFDPNGDNTGSYASDTQLTIGLLIQHELHSLESLSRCERLVINYPGFVQLGCMLILLRRSL